MGQALVTGARRGIGKAIALALGSAGFDVAVRRGIFPAPYDQHVLVVATRE